MLSRQLGTILSSIVVGLLCAGCYVPYQAEVHPPIGGLFTSTKAPLTLGVEQGANISPGNVEKNSAKTQFFLDPLITLGILSFSWGDASFAEATRQYEDGRIAYADYEFLSILGIYQELTVNTYVIKEELEQ